MSTKGNCGMCRAFEPDPKVRGVGACKRRSPQILLIPVQQSMITGQGGMDLQLQALWPMVPMGEWCLEYDGPQPKLFDRDEEIRSAGERRDSERLDELERERDARENYEAEQRERRG